MAIEVEEGKGPLMGVRGVGAPAKRLLLPRHPRGGPSPMKPLNNKYRMGNGGPPTPMPLGPAIDPLEWRDLSIYHA